MRIALILASFGMEQIIYLFFFINIYNLWLVLGDKDLTPLIILVICFHYIDYGMFVLNLGSFLFVSVWCSVIAISLGLLQHHFDKVAIVKYWVLFPDDLLIDLPNNLEQTRWNLLHFLWHTWSPIFCPAPVQSVSQPQF